MIFFRIGLFLISLLLASTAQAQKLIQISGVKDSSDSSAALEVVKAAYGRLGYEVEVHWFDGEEALEKSSSGEMDAELQRIDGLSEKYPDLVQIEIPINFLQGAVFTTGSTFEILSWHSLKSFRIGIVKGILFAEQGTEGMNVTRAESYQELFNYLKNGTVDVAVMPRINGLHALKKLDIKGIVEVDGTLETLFLYHYVHERHKDLVPKLEKIFKSMLVSGATREMRTSAYEKLLNAE